jgi:S-DNA-T family DNA segregation ATPase FtsK/SpoIIIE
VADPETPNRQVDRPLVLPLGRDVSGTAVVADLATMPHVLIAGTTGSGKSVCITSIVVSLIMNNHPDQVKLVMLDPKMVELTRFNGIPHLLGPVETDIDRIIGVLRWATREMDRRYKLLETQAARNIEAYNRQMARSKGEPLPYIALLIDEIGDLMLTRPDETERSITRLAQMARAVGMHLVVATQRPSVDIITGLIKANFPTRISFAVASGIDSRVILDTVGAETLMGRGDMLFLASDASGPVRLQGCFVSDTEIDAVVNYWKRWSAEKKALGEFAPIAVGPWEMGVTRRESHGQTEPLLEDAISLAVREGEISISMLQNKLGIDLRHATRLMDLIQDLGILGQTRPDGRSREVTLKPGTDQYRKLMERRRNG